MAGSHRNKKNEYMHYGFDDIILLFIAWHHQLSLSLFLALSCSNQHIWSMFRSSLTTYFHSQSSAGVFLVYGDIFEYLLFNINDNRMYPWSCIRVIHHEKKTKRSNIIVAGRKIGIIKWKRTFFFYYEWPVGWIVWFDFY